MKKTSALTILLSSILVGGLTAQQGPRGDRQPPSPEEMLERFDQNQDGVIELEEIQTVREERRSRFQEQAQRKGKGPAGINRSTDDANALSDSTGGPNRGPRRDPARMAQTVVERFDADGDGMLSVEELQEFFSTVQKRGGPKGLKKGMAPAPSDS